MCARVCSEVCASVIVARGWEGATVSCGFVPSIDITKFSHTNTTINHDVLLSLS